MKVLVWAESALELVLEVLLQKRRSQQTRLIQMRGSSSTLLRHSTPIPTSLTRCCHYSALAPAFNDFDGGVDDDGEWDRDIVNLKTDHFSYLFRNLYTNQSK